MDISLMMRYCPHVCMCIHCSALPTLSLETLGWLEMYLQTNTFPYQQCTWGGIVYTYTTPNSQYIRFMNIKPTSVMITVESDNMW